MNIDLGSFAFGSVISSGGGTPSWGTALGQSQPDYRITYPGAEVIVVGMVYNSVPLEGVKLPLGKGGKIYTASETQECQLAALFRKVYVNNIRVDYPFIMVLIKESSESHSGRRGIKYSDKNEYLYGGESFNNGEFIKRARLALSIKDDACWFVYALEVKNQDELHMYAVVVDDSNNCTYENSFERKKKWIELIPETTDFKDIVVHERPSNVELPGNFQTIFYGAPGTGKSNTIKREVDDQHKTNFRVTFHPDSDYSTFVGCYKPKSVNADTLSRDKLHELYPEFKSKTRNRPVHRFISKYNNSFRLLTEKEAESIFDKYETPDTISAEVPKIMAAIEELPTSSTITYSFVPQAFTKAYVAAWNTSDDVYLIIEEINRGNCAQIFGDLFQLLDRKNGVSEYPVDADADLANYLSKNLVISTHKNITDEIREGKKLVLPSNLYIWATMNTSDQSLFPIDSAFKRRWDWVYVPIDTAKENWNIEVGEKRYSWTEFLNKVNTELLTDETAEDKHLGFYFCKAENSTISKETFVGKVLFYLWNDVFKVYGIPAQIGSSKDWAYTKFYKTDGKVDENQVAKLMEQLHIEPL